MSIPLLYLDTNALIYLLEQHELYSDKVASILESHVSSGGELIASVVAITEFLAGTPLTNLSIIYKIPRLHFVPLDEALAEKAALLQRETKLQIGDAVHLATAIHAQASHFFTNDKQLLNTAAKYLPVKTL